MTEPAEPRRLTDNETAILRRFLAELEAPTSEALLVQVDQATVVGGIPTVLDLDVSGAAPVADFADGPLPGRMLGDDGEVLVWIRDGRLDGLEYAWWCDDAPTAMPPADALRFGVPQFWLATFHRWFLWSVGAVLVEAESADAARRVLNAQMPERAQRARIRRAPDAIISAAHGKAPLSRLRIPVLRPEAGG